VENSFNITTGNIIKQYKIDIDNDSKRDAIFIFLNLPESIQDIILFHISPALESKEYPYHRFVEEIYHSEKCQGTNFYLNTEYQFHKGCEYANFTECETLFFYEDTGSGKLSFYTNHWSDDQPMNSVIEVVSANCLRIKVIGEWEAVITMTETGSIIYDYIQTNHVDIYPFEYTSWKKRLPGHKSLTDDANKRQRADAIEFNRQNPDDKNMYWDSDWYYHQLCSADNELNIVGYWRNLRHDMGAVENMYELLEDFECMCDDFICSDFESIITQSHYEGSLQRKKNRFY